MRQDLVDQSNIDGCTHLKGSPYELLVINFVTYNFQSFNTTFVIIGSWDMLNDQLRIKLGLKHLFSRRIYIGRQLIFLSPLF